MKKLLYFAIVALAAAACAKTTELESVNAPAKGDVAMTFGAYTPRITKADMDLAALKLASFGVFAYYTDDELYDKSYTPNFMYNEEIEWNDGAGAWDYAPIKYWPNEYGDNAVSGDRDKVSFFAYAPYTGVTAASGIPATPTAVGIQSLSRNRETGDPMVEYQVSLNANDYETMNLDLVWGVAAAADIADWNLAQTPGAPQTNLTAGKPWLNVERPEGANQPVKFTFRHALAKLNVQIDASEALEAGTKIFIREITFTGFALRGCLNLNNITADTPYWVSHEGKHTGLLEDKRVTIYDGRKNGVEGMDDAGTDLGANPNELPIGLNPELIQTNAGTEPGVTDTPANLFAGASGAGHEDDFIAVIPTGSPMYVTIVYDVETADPNLDGWLSDTNTHGVSVPNTITVDPPVFNALEAGKEYTLKLHIGMKTVKFDAVVADWVAGADETAGVPAN